ncbi:ABC-F family ATP-binding cassette domain-containing protein [soil metagenome]
MLTINKLSKSFGGRVLFKGVDLSIQWGERVALVGPNGAGKSTLFSLILGEDEPDEGAIERDEYAMVGYLPQESEPVGEETVLEIATTTTAEIAKVRQTMRKHEEAGTLGSEEYGKAQDEFELLGGYLLEPKAKKILSGLAFRESDFNRPAKEMSGGWVMRAHLAKLLVLEPDLLMLDEPTNHLDLMSLLWFQSHLKNYGGAILMISHDRDFMDEIIETVYEIVPHDEKIVTFKGNYSDYVNEKEARYERQMSAWKNEQKEISKVQDFIKKFRSISSKASQVQSRIKQLEKMERIERPRKLQKKFHFHFPQPERGSQRVVTLDNVSQSYGDLQVYRNLDLTIERGERTVLVGPNGSGKSTLIKILAGVLPFQEGKRQVGGNTKIGYFSQHRTETLNPANTVLAEVLASNGELREGDARAVLGSFLFKREDVFKKVEVLSGGEKSRLNLVKFLVDPPNLLLMDEPTTHLDLLSIEALIQALQRFEGTLVFISHDVHFIRNIAEKVLHISAGSVTAYAGGYEYYLEKTDSVGDARAAVTAGHQLENHQVI